MSKEELNATEDAIKLIDAARQAIPRAALKAAECDRAGLGVLARSWDFIGKTLEQDLALQIKTLTGKVPEGFK